MRRLLSIAQCVNVTSLGLWCGCLLMTGAGAAVTFPTVKRLDPSVPSMSGYSGDHCRPPDRQHDHGRQRGVRAAGHADRGVAGFGLPPPRRGLGDVKPRRPTAKSPRPAQEVSSAEGAKPVRKARRVARVAPGPGARTRAARLGEALQRAYPDAHCELNYTSPHELLVATILSAQATDVSVNKATPALFERFPTAAAFAAATPEAIEPFIRSIGLYRMKAKAIRATMRDICERFGGEVPRTVPDLLTLRGVARKTAGVVLGNAFGINEAFVVDTHVHRLAQRFALVPRGASVAATEQRLMALFPREEWCRRSHELIFHGRRACKARGVKCGEHPICAEFGGACELRVTARPKRAR